MKNSEVAESFYHTPDEDCKGSNFFVERGILYSWGYHFPVAMYLNENYVLLNGDTYSNSTSEHQSHARNAVYEDYQIIIPFSALESMMFGRRKGYSINEYKKIRVIDTVRSTVTPYTYKDSKGEEKIGYHHTLGGSVFEYEGRYFISGIDSTGRGVLYFLTELVRQAVDFEDALEALKPEAVKEAEARGCEVKRQGEWFFIKTDSFELNEQPIIKDGRLPQMNGGTGHHFVSELINIGDSWYGRGVVKHEQRDHKQLKLYDNVKQKAWWKAVHNEQKGSWSAGGNVD